MLLFFVLFKQEKYIQKGAKNNTVSEPKLMVKL